MIQDRAYWKAWEEENVLSRGPDFLSNLRLVEAMYEEARLLGRFAPGDPLAGLETDLRMARVVNVRGASRTDGPKI